jgi:hypothetical protein
VVVGGYADDDDNNDEDGGSAAAAAVVGSDDSNHNDEEEEEEWAPATRAHAASSATASPVFGFPISPASFFFAPGDADSEDAGEGDCRYNADDPLRADIERLAPLIGAEAVSELVGTLARADELEAVVLRTARMINAELDALHGRLEDTFERVRALSSPPATVALLDHDKHSHNHKHSNNDAGPLLLRGEAPGSSGGDAVVTAAACTANWSSVTPTTVPCTPDSC